MKKYMLFSGLSYYPEGGMYDFIGAFETIQECKNEFESRPSDWAQIVQIDTLKIIYKGYLKSMRKFEWIEMI